MREPRESAWLPVATAKDEKASGGGGVSVSIFSFAPFCIDAENIQLHTM